ncbi:MAG: hypothetical protein WA087_02390 [Candidatus Saccharimonadales bacterium]
MGLFNKRQSNVPRRRQVENNIEPSSSILSDAFKRNRTISGTTSNNFESVNSKSDLESSRLHAHHLTIKRRKVFGMLLLLLTATVLLWAIVSNVTATVSVGMYDTAVSKPIDKKLYEDTIQDYLNNNPLSRLAFLMDQASLSTYITRVLPEVLSVSQAGMVGIGKTEFKLTLREPVAGWKIGGKQYYVDSNGVSYERNYYADPTVQIVDASGIVASAETGTVIVSNRFLSFVGRVVAISKTYGYTVIQATLPANKTRELDIRLKGSSVLVKLSIDRAVGEQIEDMSRSLKYFAGQGLNPGYVDVRVSSRAFYK